MIVYCAHEDCHASLQVAELLQNHGFSQVAVFLGGFRAWDEAGYPVDALGKRRLIFGFRLIIGGLFLYAGLSKINQPYKFAAAIQAYQLLPQFFVGLAAVLIPWIEAVCGLALLFGRKPRSALLIFMILLIFFIFIIGLTMSRGLEIDCGCGLLADRQVGG